MTCQTFYTRLYAIGWRKWHSLKADAALSRRTDNFITLECLRGLLFLDVYDLKPLQKGEKNKNKNKKEELAHLGLICTNNEEAKINFSPPFLPAACTINVYDRNL
jgi:hypothetical protein